MCFQSDYVLYENVLLGIFLLYGPVTFGQKEPEKIILSLSYYNQADWSLKGMTTYLLTESSVNVIKTFRNDSTAKTNYTKRIQHRNRIVSTLENMELDTLRRIYYNACVPAMSGNEYILDITLNETIKTISLHHFYLTQIDEIIQLINAFLPTKYHLNYLDKDQNRIATINS